MVKTFEAIFDGKVFLPTEPITLEPNTRVQVVINTLLKDDDKTVSFLEIAQSLDLDGPADWSANLDDYLYGEKGNK